MSEKEKTILSKMARLPEQLQDKFLDRLEGAAMAIDMMKEVDHEPRESRVPGHDSSAK